MIHSFKGLSKSLLFIDSFMVLLNLSTSYSIIPYLLFGQYDRYVNMLLFLGFNILYVSVRFNKPFTIPRKDALFYIYLILNVCNFFSAILTDTGWKSALIYLTLNTIFYLILHNLFKDYRRYYTTAKSLWFISRGYLWLVSLCIFSCVFMYLLIKTGINPQINSVNTRYDLFSDNYNNLGADYYLPYYLSVFLVSSDIRIPFFQDQGFVLGIYHEPHILTFMLFPALFLSLYYIKKNKYKIITLLVFLLILLLAGSTTNILAVLLCVIFYLVHNIFFINKKTFLKNFAIIILILTGSFFIYSLLNIDDLFFIFAKLGSGSMDYTQATLEFAVTPKTLIGSSFFNLSYLDRSSFTVTGNRDIGYINFVVNIVFLLVCGYYMLRLFLSKNPYKMAVFLFAVYFFIHSTKVAMVSYSLTMLMFVIFLMSRVAKLNDEQCIECHYA